MARKRGHIGFVFLLLGALLSTQGMQYLHLFGAHQEERQCDESKLHFHESEAECAFHFLYTEPFVDFGFYVYNGNVTEIQKHYFSFYTAKEGQSSIALPSLRGPPLFFDTPFPI